MLRALALVALVTLTDARLTKEERLDRHLKLYSELKGTEPVSGVLPKVFKDIKLPMSDGTRLSTIVLSPPFSKAEKWPAVIDRSPYGHFATELLADIFLLFGFVSVEQDMRGAGKSEGNFSLWHSDATDGADTLAWIAAQPWSDGRVFEIGASADGIAAEMMAMSAPPSLKGQFIIFATAEARDTFYPGGAYRQGLIDGWLKGTFGPSSDHPQWEWLIAETKRNEAPGPWWNNVTMFPTQWANITWPTVGWAGWYDIFLKGNLLAFEGVQKKADPKAPPRPHPHSLRPTTAPIAPSPRLCRCAASRTSSSTRAATARTPQPPSRATASRAARRCPSCSASRPSPVRCTTTPPKCRRCALTRTRRLPLAAARSHAEAAEPGSRALRTWTT